MQSLFDISEDMQALDDLLFEMGGDVTDEASMKTVEAFIAELKANFEAKADNYAALITTMQKRAQVRLEEAERLRQRANIDSKAADYLKAKLKMVMEEKGLKKLETARFRISVAGNGGLAPLKIYDESLIPQVYFDLVPHINMQRIREAIDHEQDVPGADIEPRGTHLRIK